MKITSFFFQLNFILFIISCNNPSATDTVDSSASLDSAGKASSHNMLSGNTLELVFEDSTYQLTGIAKEENGALLVNYPRWSNIYKYAVVEAGEKNSVKPYPNEKINEWHTGQAGNDNGYVFKVCILMAVEACGF